MSVTDTRDAEPLLVALSEDLDGGFVELFGAYRRLVFSVAVRVCGQWAQAEDLTAEAFLRAYRALRGYPPERILALQPRAWLVTILLNVTCRSPRSPTCWAAHRGPSSRISPGACVGSANCPPTLTSARCLMISDNHDPLAAELAGLAVDPPAGLLDRVVARWVRVPGPIGPLYVASTEAGIAYVRTGDVVGDSDAEFAAGFRDRFARPLQPGTRPPAGLLPALRTGRVTTLRFDLRELGAFDQAVLQAAAAIPRGQLRPYRWIAEQVGRPGAVRAVGSALGRNPVPVLIGCHRVIRSDGAVGDYVFGTQTKSQLLTVEGANLAEVRELARRGVRYLASDTTGVVCFPSCSDARRITPAHRQGFASVAAAQLAGYRPCQHCRPTAAVAVRGTSS